MIKLVKLSGSGNNFLFIDLRKAHARQAYVKLFKRKNRKKIARELCNPFQSVGADGLLFLENSSRADLKWDFYNADGSIAEMCGNAARCVGRYCLAYDKPVARLNLETKAGVVGIRIPVNKKYRFYENVLFEVEMPPIGSYEPNQNLIVKNKRVYFDFVNSGVPHAVVQMPANFNLKGSGHNVDKLVGTVNKIRELKQFKKQGTNVTFYSKVSKNAIRSLTFERGVVGYTQACGTGAVAAAVSFTKNLAGNIKVNVPGGVLAVQLKQDRPLLIGPAKIVAEIYLK